MATRASGTSLVTAASATETAVFTAEFPQYNGSDGPPFRTVRVNCSSTSAVPLGARVPTIHGTSVVIVPIGEAREFTCFLGEARTGNGFQLYTQGIGGTATYSWEIVA